MKMETKIRCKAKNGITYSWRIGPNKDGKFKALSVGKPSNHMPMDFAPFEIMDAVLGRGNVFDTEIEAESFIRSL
jgi:hypothetical protein